MTQTNEVICKNCGQSTIPFQNSGNCEFCGENALHKTKYTSNLDLAKAIIQRYPQILAEKVWEGDVREMILNNIDDGKYVSHSISITKPVEIFIKEVIE